MSLHPHHNDSATAVDLLSAIDELAENTRAHVINSRRGNNRVELNCSVRVEPANASDRGKFRFEGRCRDVSPTGGRLILEQPLLVGDVYLIYVEGDQFRLDPTFVRCIRCHMIREGNFECGVSFLSPVDLQSAPTANTAVPTASAQPVSPQAPVANTPQATYAPPTSQPMASPVPQQFQAQPKV